MRSKTHVLLHVLLIAVITNCTVQKRSHRSGYYIDWHKKSTNGVSERTTVKNDFTAANNNEINLPKREESNFASQPSVVCGDTLYLLNGEKIIGEVVEITEDIIKYKGCNSKEELIYSIKGNTVFKIQYLNGKVGVYDFKKDKPKKHEEVNGCIDTLYLTNGKAIVCNVLGYDIENVKYKKCDSLNTSEYYIEKYKLNQVSKNKYSTKETKNKEPRQLNLMAMLSLLLAVIAGVLFFLLLPAEILIDSVEILVLGLCFILPIISVILSIIGMVQISRNIDKYWGLAFSILGLILSLVVFGIVYWWLFLFTF